MKIFDLVLLAKIITVTISIAAPAFARPSEIPIIKAAREGRTSQVQALLDKGVGIESKDENGNTPLIEAVTYGQVDTVALLLKRGANPNARTKSVAAGIKLCAYGGEEVECNWHNQPVLYFALVNLTRYSRTPLQERPRYEQIGKLLIQADAKCRSENDFPQCPSSNDFPTSSSVQITNGINTIVESTSCQNALTEAVRRIESANASVNRITRYDHKKTSHSDNYPTDRPFRYNFWISGSGLDDVMSSTMFLTDITSQIISSCPSVSLSYFGQYRTDHGRGFGLMENGKVKPFECATRERARTGKIPWGEEFCP
jgi:hypothetical protein